MFKKKSPTVLHPAQAVMIKNFISRFGHPRKYSWIISGCDSSTDLTFPKSRVVVDELFASLRDIAGARALMKQFKSVYVPGSQVHQASTSGFK